MQNEPFGSFTDRPTNDPGQSAETIKSASAEAGDAIKTAAEDVVGKIKDAASGAKEQGADKVNIASDGAAASLRQVSDQLKAAVDGLNGDQAWAGKAFQTGADGLDRVSAYLASGKFDDFARDIQTFARSNPAAFLAGSVAIGFLMARVGKTAVHHATETSAPDTTTPPSPYGTTDQKAAPLQGGF